MILTAEELRQFREMAEAIARVGADWTSSAERVVAMLANGEYGQDAVKAMLDPKDDPPTLALLVRLQRSFEAQAEATGKMRKALMAAKQRP